MDKDKFIKLYCTNTPYPVICKELGLCSSSVTYYARKFKLKMRGSGRNLHYSNPFLPLRPESFYWLGYICADGHITIGNHYRCSLFSTNLKIINDFHNFCGIGKIYKRPSINGNPPIYESYIGQKSIVLWVANYLNINNRKALVLNPPIQINWDIIHGYFDGDGSIRLTGNRKESMITTGSIKWAYRIREFLYRYGIETGISKKGNAYDIHLYKKATALLYKYMYKNNTSRLEYKYKRFEQLFGNK